MLYSVNIGENMGSREKWYTIRDGHLWQVSENDGHAYMKRGPQRVEILLCTVEEAAHEFPDELAQAMGEKHDPRR